MALLFGIMGQMDFLLQQFELSLYHIPVVGLMMYFMLRPIIAGAPYVPTRRTHMKALFAMASLMPDDVVYELGCGDGYFSVAAAKKGVRKAKGFDILGSMIRVARLRARLAGVTDRCTFEKHNIRNLDLSGASLVYVYLMTGITEKLAKGAFLTLKPGARILASTFPIYLERHPSFRLIEQQKIGAMDAYLYERI